jgi:flagella basal body P-ring formation protein FlgA
MAPLADNANMRNYLYPFIILLTLTSAPAQAGTSQSHAKIQEAVADFVRKQAAALPGKASFQVAEIDARTVLPACPALEAFLPAGAQLNGNTSVGVRCVKKYNWTLFVAVNIKVSLSLLTLNKTLQQGQTIRAEDLGTLPNESLQTGALTDTTQAIGKIMKFGVGAGQILRYDMIRAPYTIKQGQSVQLLAKGTGFSVSSEGQALGNATEGEIASARTASGQIISGVVKGGKLEINQ